jgi:hypothetical protein
MNAVSQLATFPVAARGTLLSSRALFVLCALSLAIAAALLAGWAPIQFSIVTVFLFAGPHNFFEARYFLTRLPARWGRLRGFFLLSFSGIIGLTLAYATLQWLNEVQVVSDETWQLLYPLWNTVFLLWIAGLTYWRSQQNPRREWGWIWPVALLFIALAWQFPLGWGLLLVYLHPLMAFWLLDREMRRSRPEWRPAFHWCLALLPLFLGVLWWKLAATPSLAASTELDQRIANHAGAFILQGVSSHLLVATHTFLEMLHYGVWVLAIPLIGLHSLPWQLQKVPMARRSSAWRFAIGAFLVVGLAVTLILWTCFLADYTTTRSVYFTVALAHVLAEVPFLLRAL